MSRPLFFFSHLRWPFVWQRPQHLASRLRSERQCWFIEEPVLADVKAPQIQTADVGGLLQIWLEVPARDFAGQGHVGFGPRVNGLYAAALRSLNAPSHGIGWIYSPAALDLAESLRPSCVVYDVMDDLGAFRGAAPDLKMHYRRALERADVVFAGGRSLFARASAHAADRTYLFPSGVDPDHYKPARAQRPRPRTSRPVAGYLGVIDERLDLALVAELARLLPDWTIRLVGPVVKIDQRDVPVGPNFEHLGQRRYEELPAVLADFDVALMPFALNDATASISPTKTLEYFAAGLPVVSTHVTDVVAEFSGIVHFAEDAHGFADACRSALASAEDAETIAQRDRLVAARTWDSIAKAMHRIIEQSASGLVYDGEAIA